ncbi:glycosyltransferase 87 family protein [Nocardioides sp. CPCC 205120]|uniref:glycosyltransferase 87 family protein n=1 Tax=Nocardioides sp. CPCC 205120 TaxID=3406462 RepID=UPI003B501BA4
MRSVAVPTQEDPALASLSEVVGGPVGVHARATRWVPLAVAAALAALSVVLGLVARADCPAPGWSGSGATWTEASCFSDLPDAYVAGGAAEGVAPYDERVGDVDDGARHAADADHALVGATYLRGVLGALVAPGDTTVTDQRGLVPTADLARDEDVRGEAGRVLLPGAVLVGLAALVLVVAVARHRTERPWDGVLVAAAPLLLVAGLADVDLVGVALAVGGLVAAGRGRPLVAGALLGLGLTVTWSAGLVLLAVVAAGVRRGAATAALRAGGAAALVWLAVTLSAAVTGPDAWRTGWVETLVGAATPGSLRHAVEQTAGRELPAYVPVALVVLVLWTAAVLLIERRAPRPARPEQVALVLVAVAVALLGAGPASALAVLPLAVLARPRLGPLLAWQAVELVHALVLWWTVAGYLDSGSEPAAGPLLVLGLVRVGALLALAGLVVRDVVMPSYDVLAPARPRSRTGAATGAATVRR